MNRPAASRRPGWGSESVASAWDFDGDGPVSPELALVDPELARRARARLQEFEDPASRVLHGDADEPSVAAEPPRDRGAPRRRRRVRLSAFVAMAVIAAAGLIVGGRIANENPVSAQGSPARRSVAVDPQGTKEDTRTARERKPATARSGVTARKDRERRGRSTTTKAKRSARHPQKRTKPVRKAPAASRKPSAAGLPAAPVFSWVSVRGASSYDFELFRGAARVFTARPRRPRIVLTKTWIYEGRRFRRTPGRYRWLVRPIFRTNAGTRFGPAIVSAKLVLRG